MPLQSRKGCDGWSLLREVHEWTRFADHVTHVRTGDVPKNVSAMLAGVLVDATNLGPKRMAGASKGRSAQQIGWMRTFHARSGHTTRLKLASPLRTPGIRIRAFWGNDTTSSSSPFFRASDRAAKRGDISLHYSSERGSKFYSHLSDPIRLLQHFAQHRRPFETWSQNSRLSLSARFRDVGASPIQENFLPIFALRTETPLVTRRRHKAKSCDVAPSSADNLENSARQRSLIIRITQVHTASARE